MTCPRPQKTLGSEGGVDLIPPVPGALIFLPHHAASPSGKSRVDFFSCLQTSKQEKHGVIF